MRREIHEVSDVDALNETWNVNPGESENKPDVIDFRNIVIPSIWCIQAWLSAGN